VSFAKIGALNAMFYAQASRISIFTFHVYCAIWAKIGITDLHIIFLSIREFFDSRCRKRRIFDMIVKKNMYASAVNIMI